MTTVRQLNEVSKRNWVVNQSPTLSDFYLLIRCIPRRPGTSCFSSRIDLFRFLRDCVVPTIFSNVLNDVLRFLFALMLVLFPPPYCCHALISFEIG